MVFLKKVAAFSEVTLPDEFLISDLSVPELLKFADWSPLCERQIQKKDTSEPQQACHCIPCCCLGNSFALLLINRYYENMYLSVFCMRLLAK